jgi:FtsH-binding integral membrane protein
MLPFPPPLLPEPITVPGNVADGDYNFRVRFVKLVGLAHLLSIAVLGAVVAICLKPSALVELSQHGPERFVPLAFLVLIALSIGRRLAPFGQLLLLGALLLSAGAALSFWIASWHDSFPEFMEAAGFTLLAAWGTLVLYNLFCGRDYSFMGEFMISWMVTVAVTVVVSIQSRLTVAEALTIGVAATGALVYWTYDLAMILRRRTPAEPIQAIVDLYRDLLNFVGFPVRILRMPKRKGRTAS